MPVDCADRQLDEDGEQAADYHEHQRLEVPPPRLEQPKERMTYRNADAEPEQFARRARTLATEAQAGHCPVRNGVDALETTTKVPATVA